MTRERPLEIKVDMNVPCRACHKGGATQNGLCLECIAKEVKAMADKSAKDVMQADGEVVDVHPKVKTYEDGRSEHYIDVKLRVPHTADRVALLSGLLNTSVGITIAPVQLGLLKDGKGR